MPGMSQEAGGTRQMGFLLSVLLAAAVGNAVGPWLCAQLLPGKKDRKRSSRRRSRSEDSDANENACMCCGGSAAALSSPMKRYMQGSWQPNAPSALDSGMRSGTSGEALNGSFTRLRSEGAVSTSGRPGAVWDAIEDNGFSMEEAFKRSMKFAETTSQMDPKEILESLQRGNTRFWMNTATRPERSAFERRALIVKQSPRAAVLGCADSRVPVEIVFDQGLGDMFVIRNAGNTLGGSSTASVEYAVHHLGIKVVVIMGHEGCGAVKAACLPDEVIQKETPALATELMSLKQCVQAEHLHLVKDPRARDREAVVANVRSQLMKLQQNPGIMQKVEQGKLIVIGAFYEISSGIVDFYDEVKPPGANKA
mmetsp:Transcript_22935/g.50694  ORF Transcript_22935/g.50694 Transcript_22935/m.50694 type:complete len:366 (-) Transcript_22935:201-1298(-)